MKQKEKLCLESLESMGFFSINKARRNSFLDTLAAKAWLQGWETFRAQAILRQATVQNLGQLNLHTLGDEDECQQ